MGARTMNRVGPVLERLLRTNARPEQIFSRVMSALDERIFSNTALLRPRSETVR